MSYGLAYELRTNVHQNEVSHIKTNKKRKARVKKLSMVTATVLSMLLAIALWTPRIALASFIAEVEPNNTGATAQNVNGNFSLDNDPNINSSTTIPHVSIRATGDGTFDFYTFTTSGGTIILDIDATNVSPRNDTQIGIWNAAGTLVGQNDDDPSPTADPGSFEDGFGTLDSFLQLAGQPAGGYTVGVCRFSCGFANGFLMTGGVQGAGDFYTLHISTAVSTSTIPEPSAMILLGSGLASLGYFRRRRKST